MSKQDQEYDEIIFNKLKGFYNSCMDIDNINKKGEKPLIDLLNKLKINENKDKYNDPKELAKMLLKIKLYTLDDLPTPLFNIDADFNEDMTSTVPVLTKSYSFTDDIDKKDLKEVLSNIYKDSDKDIDKMIDSIYDLEKKLFETNNEENNQNSNSTSREIFTVKSLNEKYPNINWKTYFGEILDIIGKDKITDDFIVYNSNVSYFENLNSVLNEVDSETLSYYFEL